MATTYHKLSGKAVWAKVHRPDTKFEPQWSVGIVLDDEELAKFKALKKEYKLRATFKETDERSGLEEGLEYLTFRRRVKKPWGDNTPPAVEDEQGNHIAENVGNGSDITVEFQIYSYNYQGKPGHAAEFNKIIVHDLVRYEKPATQELTPANTDSSDSLPPVKTPRKF